MVIKLIAIKNFKKLWNLATLCLMLLSVALHLFIGFGFVFRSGWVKVKILRVISASHFTARIVEHAQSDGEFKKLKSDYVFIAMRMAKIFSDAVERYVFQNGIKINSRSPWQPVQES